MLQGSICGTTHLPEPIVDGGAASQLAVFAGDSRAIGVGSMIRAHEHS